MNELQPIQGPAAWRGEQLFCQPEWKLRFTAAEIEELLASADRCTLPQGAIQLEPTEIKLVHFDSKCQEIQQRLEEGVGIVRLLGFPAEQVGVDVARRAFWVLCRQLGTPVSQSAAGERLFSVRDAGFANDDSRARGPNTRKKLSFHTDRCDVIGFLCYRQARAGGDNCVVSSVSVYNQMLEERPDLVAVLMRSYLYQRHNVDAANALPYCEQPVFSIYEGHFAANLLRVLIERAYAMADTPEMTAAQREALDYLETVAARPEMHATFSQQPGDILFLNNFVTLHRRTEFVDFEEPERKRHLLRVWLAMPNSRPLDPRFAANYGSTVAGAVRGGMQPRTPAASRPIQG